MHESAQKLVRAFPGRGQMAAFAVRLLEWLNHDLNPKGEPLGESRARALLLAANVLDEPTRGVDVGAKRDIYFLIQRLAREGRGVVVISSELVELIGLCHRVVVMRGGKVQATLTADQLTEEELIAHATGTH